MSPPNNSGPFDGAGEQPGRLRLLRGGLDDHGHHGDADWQAFCGRIGWQQLTEPALAEDYEEQLLERLFAETDGDAAVIDLDVERELRRDDRERDNSSQAVSPITDEPGRAARRALPSWAALAALAAAGMFGIALRSCAGGAPSAETLPTRAPEMVRHANVAPSPAPTSSASAEPDEAPPVRAEQRTSPNEPTPKVVEAPPDPGAPARRLATMRSDEAPQRHAEPSRSETTTPAPPAPLQLAHLGRGAVGSMTSARAGAANARVLPNYRAQDGAFRSPFIAVAMPPSAPLAPATSAWAELPTPVADAPEQAGPTSWLSGSDLARLQLTAPRDDAGIPAGVRLMGMVDLSQMSRRLLD